MSGRVTAASGRARFAATSTWPRQATRRQASGGAATTQMAITAAHAGNESASPPDTGGDSTHRRKQVAIHLEADNATVHSTSAAGSQAAAFQGGGNAASAIPISA